ALVKFASTESGRGGAHLDSMSRVPIRYFLFAIIGGKKNLSGQAIFIALPPTLVTGNFHCFAASSAARLKAGGPLTASADFTSPFSSTKTVTTTFPLIPWRSASGG